jgi:hypothetical protein
MALSNQIMALALVLSLALALPSALGMQASALYYPSLCFFMFFDQIPINSPHQGIYGFQNI